MTVTSLPIRLRTPPGRMLVLLAVSAAFVAIGVFMLPRTPVRAWLVIVLFGLGLVVAVGNLLPGSAYLELDQRGVTISTLFGKTFHRWQDVAEFYPFLLDAKAMPMVALRYAPGFGGQAAVRRFAKRLAGAEGALPDTYGMTAADLAALLEKVRIEQSRGL